MIKDNYQVALKCLFCKSDLTGPEDAEFESGDLIKCNECGEENDFDSVLEVAKEKGLEQVTADVEAELENSLGKLLSKKP